MEAIKKSEFPCNCSTVVVGKNVSATGCVILGHNEDDYDAVSQAYRVPRKKHQPGETIRFGDGDAVIPQAETTAAYYWSEVRAPGNGMSYSDSFVNEWGVAVVSNSCVPCREPENGPQPASIGYGIRRIAAERAHTAREGVELAIGLAEEFGYLSSRSYEIADRNEAWVLQLTRGSHYAARRVPDDEVLYIPNWYTIHEIDWDDAKHREYYFSPDLAEFAQENGWYSPARPGSFADFDFAAAYQEKSADRSSNTLRAEGAWGLLLGRTPENRKLFSAAPARKLGPEDVKRVLRFHYENTAADASRGYELNPHMSASRHFTVCSCLTVESSVVVFDPEPDLTCIWRAAPVPCVSPYVPWYLGISRAPDGSAWYDAETAQQTHFRPAAADFRYNPQKDFWLFQTVRYLTEFDYRGTIGEVHASIHELESRWQAGGDTVKRTWRELSAQSRALAREFLTGYTEAQARLAREWAGETILRLGTERIAHNAEPEDGTTDGESR